MTKYDKSAVAFAIHQHTQNPDSNINLQYPPAWASIRNALVPPGITAAAIAAGAAVPIGQAEQPPSVGKQ